MQSCRTHRLHLRALGVAGLLLSLCVGTGCASTIQGRVLDAETGQPIAGAVVLGVWIGGGGAPGLPHSVLVGVREAETDVDGRFVLENMGRLFVEESITVYQFGYIAWNNIYSFPGFERRKDRSIPPQIRLERFPPSGSHSQHIEFVHLATSSSHSSGHWVKFRESIARESRMR